jgi:uncharacterized membrane protein YphA (DoxX/SURF4 family)
MIWRFLKSIPTSPYLSLILRVYVGYFFLYASMSKIPYPAQFAEAVAAYQILPYWFLNLGVVVLPWIEFVSALFLIIGLRTRAAAAVVGLMLIMFGVMVATAMYSGTAITCGCYDTVGEPVGWKKCGEQLLLLAFTVQVFFYDRLFTFGRGGYGFSLKEVAAPSAGPRQVSP